MSTTQQTLSQLDQAREAEQNHTEAPVTIMRENRTRISIPERTLQDVIFENEAVERWLDDGGIEGRKGVVSKKTW